VFDSCLRLSSNRRYPRLAALCVAHLRPACIYVRRSRVLFIWPLRLPARPSPGPRLTPAASVASRNGKGAYLRRCAHITPTDKLASLSSCLCSSSFDFPGPQPSSAFLAISVKYFKDRLPVVPLAHRLRFRVWIYANDRLDLAAIPLFATSSRCCDTSIVSLSFSLLLRKIDCYVCKRHCPGIIFFSASD